MYKCVLALLIVFDASWCVTVNRLHGSSDIRSKFKIPMTPLVVKCKLTDMITIYFPVLQIIDVIYKLHMPNGEEFPMTGRNISNIERYPAYNEKTGFKAPKVVTGTKFHIFNVNDDKSYSYGDEYPVIKDMNDLYDIEVPNRKITIGPLGDDDCGNWVLSIFFKDSDNQWVEMFQVITVDIEETVPVVKQKENGTVMLSFGYPIFDIETCELVSPAVAVDNEYERNPDKLAWCGYILRNYNPVYNGRYKIFGVGKIVYKGTTILRYPNRL